MKDVLGENMHTQLVQLANMPDIGQLTHSTFATAACLTHILKRESTN